MTENELYHHGVKGQKWGVRKQYKFEKRQLSNMKREAWETGKFAKLYDKQKRKVDKKVAKRLEKDPNAQTYETKYWKNTQDLLTKTRNAVVKQNNKEIKDIQNRIKEMNKKYSDKHIKELRTGTTNNGLKYVKSKSARLINAGTYYDLASNYAKTGRYYTPRKTTYTYIPIM